MKLNIKSLETKEFLRFFFKSDFLLIDEKKSGRIQKDLSN